MWGHTINITSFQSCTGCLDIRKSNPLEQFRKFSSSFTEIELSINPFFFSKVKTVLLSGLKILNSLNTSDLEEVRHYRDPPDGVVKIMDTICLLFNRPPGWESIKQLLGQANFFQVCENRL